MIYLLDANVFIQAKNLHYGFDFCPAFWDWLIKNNNTSKVYSIEKVRDEIKAGDDDLANWVIDIESTFFLTPDAKTVSEFANVSNWAASQSYDAAAINTFLQVADFYLISHALAKDFTIVTHEVPSGSTKKIKIPNVCADLGIKCMTPYEMLRVERARFILG